MKSVLKRTSLILLAGGSCLQLAADPTAAVTPGVPSGEAPVDPIHLESAEPEQLTAKLSIGYESMYVSSGAQAAYASLQPSIELGYMGFTAGMWANNPLDSQQNNPNGPFNAEYQFFITYSLQTTDWLHLDLGFTYYLFPEQGSTPNRTRELNFALVFDVFLSPTLAYNYDFDLRQNEVALTLEHEQSLSQWLPFEGLSVGAFATLGYINTGRPESDQGPDGQTSQDYIYGEIAVDFIYTYKENIRFYAGPRFASNGNGENNLAGRNNNFWWGIGSSIEF